MNVLFTLGNSEKQTEKFILATLCNASFPSGCAAGGSDTLRFRPQIITFVVVDVAVVFQWG